MNRIGKCVGRHTGGEHRGQTGRDRHRDDQPMDPTMVATISCATSGNRPRERRRGAGIGRPRPTRSYDRAPGPPPRSGSALEKLSSTTFQLRPTHLANAVAAPGVALTAGAALRFGKLEAGRGVLSPNIIPQSSVRGGGAGGPLD
jgi:hypothetical protein